MDRLVRLLSSIYQFLIAPVRGARRGKLNGQEVLRSGAAGGVTFVSVLAALAALQEFIPQLAKFGLDPQQVTDAATLLGALITILQLVRRYFQHDSTPLPVPGPGPAPLPDVVPPQPGCPCPPRGADGPAVLDPGAILGRFDAESTLSRVATDVAATMVPRGVARDAYARGFAVEWISLVASLVPVIQAVLTLCSRKPAELVALARGDAARAGELIRPVVRRAFAAQYRFPLLARLFFRSEIERLTDDATRALVATASGSTPERVAAVMDAVRTTNLEG